MSQLVATEAINDARPTVRILAARALGQRGAWAVPILAQAIGRDKDPLVRREYAAALARIGPPAIDAVPALSAAFRTGGYGQTEDLVGQEAAAAVGRIDPQGKASPPCRSCWRGPRTSAPASATNASTR